MKNIPVKLILLLTPMVMALPVAMDIYVPALPVIAENFNITAGIMQLTLTLFMLTAGFLQLVIGPLSDQHGRRQISLFCIVIFALGSILCATATSIQFLIICRSIQAVGASGMMVIAFAIVRDLYHGEKSAQVYSFLNGVISFSPMFAPFAGSYLDVYFGWQATFIALLVIAVCAFVTISIIKETLPNKRRQLLDMRIFNQYGSMLRNKTFFIYTVGTAIGLSYLYLFCSISPYIIIRLLHIPELHYGYYFCFMGISFFIGSFLSGIIVRRIGIYNTVLVGFIITLIGGITMATWYFMTGLTISNFIWPMLLIGVGGTFCMGAGTGGAMEPFAHMAGRAAALGGAFRFVFAAILGSILITKHVSSTLPLALPAIIFSVLGLVVFLYCREKLR